MVFVSFSGTEDNTTMVWGSFLYHGDFIANRKRRKVGCSVQVDGYLHNFTLSVLMAPFSPKCRPNLSEGPFLDERTDM